MDPDLERWLRDLFERRGLPFPEPEPEAGLAHPVDDADPERQRHGPRLVGRGARRRRDRRAARPASRDAPDVGRLGHATPAGPGTRAGCCRPHLRTAGLGESMIAERLGALLDPGLESHRRDVRPRGRRGHPDLRLPERGGGRGDARRGRRGRGRCASSAITSGDVATRPGRVRSANAWTARAGGWRSWRSGRAARSSGCSARGWAIGSPLPRPCRRTISPPGGGRLDLRGPGGARPDGRGLPRSASRSGRSRAARDMAVSHRRRRPTRHAQRSGAWRSWLGRRAGPAPRSSRRPSSMPASMP